MINRPWKRALRYAVLVVAMVPAAAVHAQQRSFDLPEQEATKSIPEFARQAGIQISAPSAHLKGLRTPAIKGQLTTDEALSRLLEGTGLTYKYLDSSTIAISLKPLTQGRALHMAQASSAGRASSGTPSTSSGESQALPSPEEHGGIIPEILVIGRNTLNMDIRRSRDDALPYVTFEREQIERSGAANVEEFLKNNLPMSVQIFSNNQATQLGTSNGIGLRGLGSNQTLILVDGHRTSSLSFNGSASQPDLNGIPLSSIERIEVLPTTASGIYGGSATGGVINVVLRRDFSGIEATVGYDGTFEGGGERRHVDVSAGFNLEDGRTNILLSGSYADSSPLFAGDRDLVQRYRDQVFVNDPQGFLAGSFPPVGSTTNICSAVDVFPPFGVFSCGGAPLTLDDGTPIGGTITFIPNGYEGVSSDGGAQLATNAGQYNLSLADTAQAQGGGRSSLLSDPTVESISATVRREFTSRLQAFLELSASNNSWTFLQNDFGRFNLPASEPGNPFAQDIIVATPTLGADSAYESSLRRRRALAGVIVRLPGEWQGELDYTWDRTRGSSSAPPIALTSDADAAIASGELDLFRDTNEFPVDFGPYLDPASRFVNEPADITLKDATLRLSGPLGLHLPGGELIVSGLLEHRRESLSDSSSVSPTFSQFYPSRRQTVDSAYLETRLPLVSAANAVPGVRGLELTLAARHDRYETEGANTLFSPTDPVVRATNRFSSTDPTASLKFTPLADLQLRASYGTGFLPPAVQQITPTTTINDLTPLAAFGFTDPRRGNEPIGGGVPVVVVSGGNPDLKPEESESWSAGIVLMPRFAPGLRASVDWVRIDKTDNIASPFFLGSVPSVFDFEDTIPGLITRGPPSGGFDVGPVTTFSNMLLINVARQEIAALDVALDYRRETANLGVWAFSAVATHQVTNEVQVLPGSQSQELAETINGGLAWKANATLSWDYRRWGLGWRATYFDSYWASADHSVNPSQGSATIPSQMYHDVFARYRLGSSSAPGWLSNVEVQLGLQNVFDEKPPLNVLVNSTTFYDVLGDARLRRYSLGVTTVF